MKLTRIISAAVAALLISSACTDITSLEERLDSLESRVKAIENVIPVLNSNIETLQAMAEGTTINSVETIDGKYKITLSNGNVLYLTQGSVGVANSPILSVDAEGWWMVDYRDGYGFQYILCDGQKVKATGHDGITPQIGVDENGFWTVSYDNGSTWEQVKDADGKPVEAVPSEGADEFFDDIKVTEDSFTITFKDGKTISVPIVSGFLFRINAPKTIEFFKAGQAKEYVIVSKGVASASVIAVPDGFEVTLTDAKLFIKAKAATKATADSRIDVAVLAISEQGFAAISKVFVQLEGTDLPDIDDPSDPSDPSDPENPEDPENPSDPEDPEPPVDPEQPEDPAPADGTNLQAWIDGKNITVGGMTLNKSMFEDLVPVHITAESNTAITGNGVYFIDPDVTAKLDMTGKNASRIIIIGNDPLKRSVFKADSQLRLAFTEGTDYAVFCNVEADFSNSGNYPVNITNNAAGEFDNIIFENCFITSYAGNGNFHYNGVAGKGFGNFVISNSEFLVPEGQATFKLIAASKGQNYRNITFDNSIVYSKSDKAVKFNIWEGFSNGTVSVLEKLTIRQSSFINLMINNGFVRVTDLKEIDMHNNVFYTTDSSVNSWQYILRAETNGPSAGTGKDNYAYIQGNDAQSYKMFYADAQMNAIGAEQFKKSPALFDASAGAVFDVENGIFTPSKNYAKHGAQR